MVARSRYGRQRTNPITITMMAALRGFEPRLPAPQAGVISRLHYKAKQTSVQVGFNDWVGSRRRKKYPRREKGEGCAEVNHPFAGND